MIMAKREFLENININERNSLPDLVQNISPDSEEEINLIDHSITTIQTKIIKSAFHVVKVL